MPRHKLELFTRWKCPNCLPWGHSPGRPRRTRLRTRGYSNPRGQLHRVLPPVSRWAALGPGASRCLRPARLHRRGRDSARGERGPGARESQASGDRGPGLPPRPSDTRGIPGLPRAVTQRVWTRVHPRGRFPGGRGEWLQGRRAPGAPPPGGPPPGGDRARPLPGARAPAPSGAEPSAPGTAGPSGLPTPLPWPRRRPAPGGVNKRRSRFDLARPGFLAGVPPEQVTPWEGWKLVSGIPGQRHSLWFCF